MHTFQTQKTLPLLNIKLLKLHRGHGQIISWEIQCIAASLCLKLLRVVGTENQTHVGLRLQT